MEEVNKENNIKHTGFWRRLASFIFEGFIINIMAIPAYILLLFYSVPLSFSDEEIELYFSLIQIPVYILFFIAMCYLYYKYGQSIGYKIFGFKIVDEKTREVPPKGILFKRFAIKSLVPLSFIISVILFVIGSFDKIVPDFLSVLGDINGYIIAAVVLFTAGILFYFVDNLYIVFDKKKRALHDKWSGLVVIDEKNVSSLWIWLLNVIPMIVLSSILIFIVTVFLYYFNNNSNLFYIDNSINAFDQEELKEPEELNESQNLDIEKEEFFDDIVFEDNE